MKETMRRTIVVSFILIAASLVFSNLNGPVSGGQTISRDSSFVLPGPVDDMGFILPSLVGSSDEIKHITASIEDIQIHSLVNSLIFPNTPVDFVVFTKGPTPETITLFINMDDPSFNITLNVQDANYVVSDDLQGLIEFDEEGSSFTFNSTSKNWEAVFSVTFQWSYPKDFPSDIGSDLVDVYGGTDDILIEDVYTFEPDLIMSGEPIAFVDDPSALTSDGYLKGGVNLQMSQISVHFEGAPEVSPKPEDVTVGVSDSRGRFWEYQPLTRQDLNDIYFSIPVSNDDGLVGYDFTIVSSPEGSDRKGKAHFEFIIDSTSPSIADFRYDILADHINLSWGVMELGSGIQIESIRYQVRKDDRIIIPWNSEYKFDSNIDRLLITIPDNTKGELEIIVQMNDRVGNSLSDDQTYIVYTDPVPAHDISIDMIGMDPEIVIINQNINFRVTIRNRGTEDESDIMLQVTRNNLVVTYIDIPILPAGSKREIRWSWKAVEGLSHFKLSLDPSGLIDDANLDDNTYEFFISPEYLDVTVKDDSLILSDTEAGSMDLIQLYFCVRSIGSIESGPIKITFLQDGDFMGLYQVPSIYKEGSYELVVDWKVDTSASKLTLMVDPYNEILESMEDNNIIDFPNPLFKEEIENDDANVEDPNTETLVPSGNEDTEGKQGNDEIIETVWSGPEEEIKEDKKEDSTPLAPVIIQPTPSDPKIIPPFILPLSGVLMGTAFLGLSIFGLRSEIFKFKFLTLLIPLYSKLKNNKIEKGVRHEILGYLKAKPGANYSELKRNLDLNNGSLIHHLRILEREEKVYSKKMGKYKLFYVSSYRRQASIRDYISPFQLRILELILQNPGIVPKKLSNILDRSQTDMSYHLSELGRNGLLQKRKKGRNIHYYIADEYSDILV